MFNEKQKILILGGTNFIGRNVVQSLLTEDIFEITLFNRQETNPHLFPSLNKLKGNRETNEIEQISNTPWDFVIDLSCYFPDELTKTLAALTHRLKRYIFISTCSVYDHVVNQEINRNETAPTLSCSKEQKADKSILTYGNRKAECERILTQYAGPHIILRPALVFGRYDHTDRFYYWPFQVKTNPKLLIPEDGIRLFSMTYVGDLVKWVKDSLLIDEGNYTFNAVSYSNTSIREIIMASQEILGKENELHSINDTILQQETISEWTDIPLWLNTDLYTYHNGGILLKLTEPTPIKRAIKETFTYYESIAWRKPIVGISETRRLQLLEQYCLNH